MRFSVILALALLVPVSAAPAFAQVPAAGDDIVRLTDGGMLRGTILEILPNDHVTLQLANGQTATIEWSHVAKIEQRGQAPAPGPAPAPAPAPAPVPAPARSARGTAFVHVEADRPVRLESQTDKGSWQFACSSPCDRELDLGPDYRILGDGVRASRVFQLEGRPGERILVEVDTASKAGFVGGIVMTSVAPVVSIVGLAVWAVSSSGGLGKSDGGQSAGVGLAIGGLVGLTLGIVLIASNASSKQAQSITAPPHAGFAEPALFRF